MTLTSFVCPSISAQRISSVTSPTAALDIPNLPLHPTLTTVSCPLTHCSESSHTFQWAADLQQCLSVGHCVLTRCSSTALLKRCREHSHTAMGLPMFVCSLLVVPCLHTADPWQYQMALFCLGFVCLFLQDWLVCWFVQWVFSVFFVAVGPSGFCKHFISVFSLWKFWSVKDSCLKTINSLCNLLCTFSAVSGLQTLLQLVSFPFFLSPSLPLESFRKPAMENLYRKEIPTVSLITLITTNHHFPPQFHITQNWDAVHDFYACRAEVSN